MATTHDIRGRSREAAPAIESADKTDTGGKWEFDVMSFKAGVPHFAVAEKRKKPGLVCKRGRSQNLLIS